MSDDFDYREQFERAEYEYDKLADQLKQFEERLKAAEELIEYFRFCGMPYDERYGKFKHLYSMYERANEGTK